MSTKNSYSYNGIMATGTQMNCNQSDLDFALKMYGQATLDYAKYGTSATYDNMVFWQNQVWMCAKEVTAN
jgi:hypothetical protein